MKSNNQVSIPNCIPTIAGNEKKYLNECVDTGWLSSVGPFVDKFESDFARYLGVNGACAVSSGTAAIHLGLLSLGVKRGDCVICPSTTFVASANPILYCGAEPIFIDINENDLNIDVDLLEKFLEEKTALEENQLVLKDNGKRISALVVVHLYGLAADMQKLMEITKKYNLPILEDAAESLGSKCNGEYVGTIGDIGCFSFNGNKVITSGGGGMLIAKDEAKLKLCKHLSTQAKIDATEFIHDVMGFNYRMSNLCAAVGVAQLEKLDENLERKRNSFSLYKKLFANTNLIELLDGDDSMLSTYWMSIARIKNAKNFDMVSFIKSLNSNGVGVRPVWYPLRRLDMFKGCLFAGTGVDMEVYNTTFCLPSSVLLSAEDIEVVVEKIERTLRDL